MTTHTNIQSNIVHHGQAHNHSFFSHIIIGTPLHLAKLLSQSIIPMNEIKLVCFDDADISGQFEKVQEVICSLPMTQFLLASSSSIRYFDSIIPELSSVCEDDISHRGMMHYYMVPESFIEKMDQLKTIISGLCRKTSEQIIIFCSVIQKF